MNKLICWRELFRHFGLSGITLSVATLILSVVNEAGAQTNYGQHGVATRRVVINFRSLPTLETQIGLTNRNQQRVVPDPTGDSSTNGAGGESFAAAGSPESNFVPASSGIPSPAPTVSFQALPDNNTSIPPDTHGAVGPNHVMTVLNTQV